MRGGPRLRFRQRLIAVPPQLFKIDYRTENQCHMTSPSRVSRLLPAQCPCRNRWVVAGPNLLLSNAMRLKPKPISENGVPLTRVTYNHTVSLQKLFAKYPK